MGLLDDAIREHLDLKRARGGDPAEIERMEREALGPVRREPTIGSAHFDSVEQPPAQSFEQPEFHEEHPVDLEELQELGYHDSTAPHPHHGEPQPHHLHLHLHHEQDHDHHEPPEPHRGPDDTQFEHFTEELEQPKRRFLRRNRPASLSEPAAPDPGFHEEQPTEHHSLLEPVDDHPQAAAPAPSAPPPHLQFEQPPKRPRFTAEPPAPEPETAARPETASAPADAAPAAPAPAPASPPPAPASPPPAPVTRAPEPEQRNEPAAPAPGTQETTEFDVEQHLAKAPHEEDEDVLEETPEFLQDTPEHDRLWFEQRPPKDFDFNG